MVKKQNLPEGEGLVGQGKISQLANGMIPTTPNDSMKNETNCHEHLRLFRKGNYTEIREACLKALRSNFAHSKSFIDVFLSFAKLEDKKLSAISYHVVFLVYRRNLDL